MLCGRRPCIGGAAALSAEVAARRPGRPPRRPRASRNCGPRSQAFDGCSLKTTATRLVFSDGNPAARVMAVGEAPGAEEDRRAAPSCGRSGQLLDRMLAAIGLDRSQVYIANVVPWRPPGNRTPTPQEVAICLPFIDAADRSSPTPSILICLGGLRPRACWARRRGSCGCAAAGSTTTPAAASCRAMPMLHPAYLLRQPAHKKLAWRDLRALRKALDGASP